MNRRDFIGALAVGASSLKLPRSLSRKIRVAFGSCLQQNCEQPIWRAVAAKSPDLFIFLGDNIYADTEDMSVMAAKYKQLGENFEFRQFRSLTPIAATWDDHDFGRNDAGSDYPFKEESKRQMLDFFGEPLNSPRRGRPGIYSAQYLKASGLRIQILLLDLRWFRSPLSFQDGIGYVPTSDPTAQLLGEAQWQWLNRELQEPADVRILCSSIQLASSEHPWEKWANFPAERERLLNLLDQHRIQNLIAISGDMHFGEISYIERPSGQILYDITASGLNRFEGADAIPNSRRLHLYDQGPHFGLLEIDPLQPQLVEASVCDVLGLQKFKRLLHCPSFKHLA